MKKLTDKKFISAIFAAFCLFAQIQTNFAQADETNLTAELYKSAEKNMDGGKYDQAIADYVKIISLAPGDANAYNGRGNAYLEKGELDKAIADFDKNIELAPEDFFGFYGRGRAYFLKDDYEKSIDDHTRELELQSNRSLGQLERGIAYAKLKQFDEAFADYNRAIDSTLPAAYLVRGLAFRDKGETAAAIGDLRYYLDRIPDDRNARETLLKLGVNAAELPAPIFADDKNVPAAAKKLFAAAIEQIGQTEYDKATFNLSEAVKIYPKFAAAFFYRGYISELRGSLINYSRINADYSAAIALNPKFVEAYDRRAYVYFFNSQKAKANTDIARAFVVNPKSAQTIFYRGYLSRQEAKSLPDYDLAIRLDPNYAESYAARAEIFENKKQYDKAIADYSAILKINPNDRRGYEGRAKNYCAQGKKELAAADEKKFKDLGGELDSPCEQK